MEINQSASRKFVNDMNILHTKSYWINDKIILKEEKEEDWDMNIELENWITMVGLLMKNLQSKMLFQWAH